MAGLRSKKLQNCPDSAMFKGAAVQIAAPFLFEIKAWRGVSRSGRAWQGNQGVVGQGTARLGKEIMAVHGFVGCG